MMMLPIVASAHDIEVKNADDVTIYYNYVNNGTKLAVTYRGASSYSGNVVIPEEVTYMNETRRVTYIGDRR
jgi:heptaprenylglyceryl phosphate synthase